MEIPKDQIAALLDCGLHTSAQMLGCFLVSSSSVNVESNPQLKAENLLLLGDALFHKGEYRRAIHIYKQAFQYCKVIPRPNSASSRSSMSTSYRSSPNFNGSLINENEVKFKIASCHFSLNETKAALAEMEGIPSKARNLQMSLLMAKLFRNSKHNRSAVACYKECLRQCPYVIEAIQALAELGAASKDIISLFPQTPNRNGRVQLDQNDSSRWLQRYVEAHCCVASNDYKGALGLFSELLQRFPNNVHILLEMAKLPPSCPWRPCMPRPSEILALLLIRKSMDGAWEALLQLHPKKFVLCQSTASLSSLSSSSSEIVQTLS